MELQGMLFCQITDLYLPSHIAEHKEPTVTVHYIVEQLSPSTHSIRVVRHNIQPRHYLEHHKNKKQSFITT